MTKRAPVFPAPGPLEVRHAGQTNDFVAAPFMRTRQFRFDLRYVALLTATQ